MEVVAGPGRLQVGEDDRGVVGPVDDREEVLREDVSRLCVGVEKVTDSRETTPIGTSGKTGTRGPEGVTCPIPQCLILTEETL